MFQKQFFALLMAAAVTATMAFSTQEDDTPKQEPNKKALKAVVEDGKVFVIDADGEKREIDVSDARSIMIRHSNRTVNNQGEQKDEVRGEAIIIGPDGERTVIELDGAGAIELPGMPKAFNEFKMDFAFPDIPGIRQGAFPADALMPGTFQFQRGDFGEYMIGIHCQPVGGALRSHLELAEGMGLLVHAVTPGSPAEDANLKEHDILLYADDVQLGSVSDLTKSVELAGKEDRAFSLALIRAGAEERVEVSPVKRPENQIPTVKGFRMDPGARFQIQQMGPGLILGQDDDLQETVQRLRDEMRKMREDMKQMMERDK